MFDLGGAFEGIADIASLFGAGERADDAAYNEQARIAAVAAANSQAAADQATLLKSYATYGAYGIGIIGAIIIIIILIRRKG